MQENTIRYPQIECIQKAVGEKIGQVDIYSEPFHQFSSILPLNEEFRKTLHLTSDMVRKLSVPMTTLDNDLADIDKISVLKVDVQGYEPMVFEGAKAVLKRTENSVDGDHIYFILSRRFAIFIIPGPYHFAL